MKDKIVLVTGATSGIGLETAKYLAKIGAHVILHGRDIIKTENIFNDFLSLGYKVDFVVADLSIIEDINKMAGFINNKYQKLDVIVNNAGGIMKSNRELTDDIIERTLAVNVLSIYLLTGLLFDLLKNANHARIINVSSMAHKFAKPDFDDIQMENKYTSLLAYSNAKLFVIMFTQWLDLFLKKNDINNITVNALHPGVIRTNFAKDSKGTSMNFLFRLFSSFMKSPQNGAKTQIFLAEDESVKDISGGYFSNSKKSKIRKKYINDENTEKLINFCIEMTNFQYSV